VGLKSLGLGTGQYDDLDFGGVREGKGSWDETLKPYDDTSRKIGLLGFDPRTLGVVFRLLDGEFAPWSKWVPPEYSPMESFSSAPPFTRFT